MSRYKFEIKLSVKTKEFFKGNSSLNEKNLKRSQPIEDSIILLYEEEITEAGSHIIGQG